jgi:hypothetical protein
MKHLGGINMRKRGSFSYSSEEPAGDPDLIEQINKLRKMKKSPYWNRSFADVAGMILLEHVPQEIDKYEGQKKQG